MSTRTRWLIVAAYWAVAFGAVAFVDWLQR